MLRTITSQCRSLRTKNFIPSIAVVPAYRLRHRRHHPTRILPLTYYSTSTPTTTPSTTTTITTATHCRGCGAPFQQAQPDQPGYLITPTASSTTTTPAKKKKPSSGLDHASYTKLVEQLDPEIRALLEGTDEILTSSSSTSTSTSTADVDNNTPTTPATPICQRCHQLTYHTRTNEPGDAHFLRASQQYSSLVSFLSTKRQPLLLYVMDVTDMPWSIQALQPLLLAMQSPRVVIVANKVDLLPTHAIKHHDQRIRDAISMNIKRTLAAGNTTTTTTTTSSIVSVHLVSAKKGWGIQSLIKRLQHQYLLPTDDLYVVGNVNAGKSALINQFLNHHSRSLQKHQYRPTSSSIPGTTLGLVRIPLHIFGLQQQHDGVGGGDGGGGKAGLQRDHYLIDTPGLISSSTPILKKTTNKKPSTMHPVTFRLHAQQSLLLDHLIRIDVLETQRPLLMTLFTPSAAPHITKTAKLLNDPPHPLVQQPEDVIATMTTATPSSSMTTTTKKRNNQAVMDLAFAGGIGWVALTGDFGHARLRVWLDPQLPPFVIRDPSFLPFEFRGQVRKFFGSGERAMQ